jgi:hypothetical protein
MVYEDGLRCKLMAVSSVRNLRACYAVLRHVATDCEAVRLGMVVQGITGLQGFFVFFVDFYVIIQMLAIDLITLSDTADLISRYTDFGVNEICLDGTVLHLKSDKAPKLPTTSQVCGFSSLKLNL